MTHKCQYCKSPVECLEKECSKCGAPNSNIRRIYYIDVGNLPEKELVGFMKGVRAALFEQFKGN